MCGLGQWDFDRLQGTHLGGQDNAGALGQSVGVLGVATVRPDGDLVCPAVLEWTARRRYRVVGSTVGRR